MKNHSDMREGGVFSVWIGQYRTEEALDEYMSGQWTRDFGFAIDPLDPPEFNLAEEGDCQLDALVAEMSSGDRLKGGLAAATTAHPLPKAACVLVFYNFRYDTALRARRTRGDMEFFGVFPYG
ncbi:immunity 22 family protein [Trinickia terrae]|nr:immunity 22 family protein [Trinickia terrae]